MGGFRLNFSAKAAKDLDELSDDIFHRITEACKRLERGPVPESRHVKRLKGYDGLYRLRAGEYRIIFEWIGQDINIVRILTRQAYGKKY
ncbi:MAG: type II toxin-antitoxin system RelE/ParE family toxin [Deltaproteobacteria bacterium]|nr:type II toxin-antitoxin system RelE/ParE family toxin [Deltaproteobacteria bacterium]